MNQTRIARINADDYLIKLVKINVIRVLLTVKCAQTKLARMENVENIENQTSFLKPEAFFSIVAQARE
jgi:hypothetical protein